MENKPKEKVKGGSFVPQQQNSGVFIVSAKDASWEFYVLKGIEKGLIVI